MQRHARAIFSVVPVIVAAVFLFAAFEKASRVQWFGVTVGYALPFLKSGDPLLWAATFVIVWKALIGYLLLARIATRTAAVLAIATLSAFSLVLVRMMYDPFAPPCECGAWLGLASKMAASAPWGLARNLVLIWVLVMFLPLSRHRAAAQPIPSEVTS